MGISKTESEAFEAAVMEQFSFIEQDFNLRYAGLKTVEGDPRDSGVVAKYRQGEFRVNIAWAPFEMSLGVLIRLNNSDLGRRERYVYFEPYVEFISDGSLLPVVPQIYPGMSVTNIEKAMKNREHLFEHGLGDAISKIAERLRAHLGNLQGSPAETVRRYQEWYQARGKAGESRR